MKRLRVFLAVALVVLAMAGVACHEGIKTPEKMTPKERGVLATSLYNNAYSNYLLQFDATPKPMDLATREYFDAYKKAMETVYPVISAYNAIAQMGAAPTADQEAAIIRAIYQLQAMLMSGGKG